MLEDNGDEEPSADAEWSLGWTAMEVAYGRYGVEHQDFELDDADDEPSLGSLNNHHCQTSLGRSGFKELEDEHDGGEPCCEDEGAQCDDEGAINADLEGWQHAEFSDYDWQSLQAAQVSVPARVCQQSNYTVEDWRAATAAQAGTTAAAAVAVRDLREVMARHGLQPVPHLRVLGGAIVKG